VESTEGKKWSSSSAAVGNFHSALDNSASAFRVVPVTAALGGHADTCSKCGHEAISFNSCRNRHCPKCQPNVRDRWLEARGKELLPTHYVHVVFTLPRHLSPLALQNKREIYALLFRASAETLLQVARDPKRLGAEIGFSASSIPGTRSSSIIRTFIASFPRAV
jgi:hypothetical protein